jgi:23S rRNA pseudouridine1911/1915/1917 synthase
MVVPQSLPLERLDIFLRTQFPAISRGMFQRLIEEGEVRVNGQMVKPTHHPRAGETIQIHWPEPKAPRAEPEAIPLQIVFEDEDLIILNKPAGLVVHPSAGHEQHTLVNALMHHCQGSLSGIGGVARPGIVHRLDKDTSGCMVVAKSDPAHLSLASQFAGREVEKHYLLLVCGNVSKASGEIRTLIGRHAAHRKRMAVLEDRGREAWTSYRVLESLGLATLIEARIHTGRTHQIRVHFHHLGYPLLGDMTYGTRVNKRLTELTGYVAPRQMLHSWKLRIRHPRTKLDMTFEASVPQDMQQALASLRTGPDLLR